MNRLALVAFVCPWLVACEKSPSAPTSHAPSLPQPSFATLANERVPVAGSFEFNPCPPEEVVNITDGYFHFLVTGEVGPTTEDVTIHVNAESIEGVGETTGARYSVPANSSDETIITDAPPTLTEDYDLRFRLVREGSPDNLWLRLTFAVALPAGTTDVRRMEIECRG